MADSEFLTGEASPEVAAPLVGLIGEAASVATLYFDQLANGEVSSAYVTLTADTSFGNVPLGIWNFLRAADGTVSLAGSSPEDNDG
ncbi:hypothetical protein ABZ682_23090 [Streptomyces griseoviridis]|uniref:hypothetical protein n=1 Tax=Streptomyces griseoviridis TaxID=45398 RepID=UPI0033DADFAC